MYAREIVKAIEHGAFRFVMADSSGVKRRGALVSISRRQYFRFLRNFFRFLLDEVTGKRTI